jgi:23S rRNA pseudouridine1911/1915/1917 synthase
MTETLNILTTDDDVGHRLDKVLTRHAPDLSRARIQALIEQGHLTLAGKPVDTASRRVKAGEDYTLLIPPPEDAEPVAQDIALNVAYEDKDLLVIDKPVGLVVHPAAGNHDGTLVNALLAHCGASLSGVGGVRRPGIVHRLDKDTSGLMVVAKNDVAHHGLSEQLSSRTLKRVYHAIVWGLPSPTSGRVETQIGRSRTNRQKMAVLASGGKEAITDYALLENFGMLASLVECRLQTGRTHQIRVHMAHLRHWMVGDRTYGHPSARKLLNMQKADDKVAAALLDFPRQALHAAQLEFVHPIGKNKIALKSPLPPDMASLLKTLRKKT